MQTKERIRHESGDKEAWICVCGNKPQLEGFRPCDADGAEVEPVAGWEGLYVCDRCGRIIQGETRKIVGRRTED